MNKLSDAKQLDWKTAKNAAECIARICNDAGFVAPEAIDKLRDVIADVESHMNMIADALLISGKVRQ